MPIGQAPTIAVAIALDHGRGLHDRGCGAWLLFQAAADHVQPAFDPSALLGVAHGKQSPAPQRSLDLQAANAPAAFGAESHRDPHMRPARPLQNIERRFGHRRRKRPNQLVEPEFTNIDRRYARIAGRAIEFGKL